jgi:hypothetical protein
VKTSTNWVSLSEYQSSSSPYEVVITDGGLGVLARYVVVSRRADMKSALPTVRNSTGTPVASPTVYYYLVSRSALHNNVLTYLDI